MLSDLNVSNNGYWEVALHTPPTENTWDGNNQPRGADQNSGGEDFKTMKFSEEKDLLTFLVLSTSQSLRHWFWKRSGSNVCRRRFIAVAM